MVNRHHLVIIDPKRNHPSDRRWLVDRFHSEFGRREILVMDQPRRDQIGAHYCRLPYIYPTIPVPVGRFYHT